VAVGLMCSLWGEWCEPILVAELTYIGHDGDLYSFV